MFKTSRSVGADLGSNRISDVAKIQLALYTLKHLKESDFLKELPFTKPASKKKLISPILPFPIKVRDLPKGSTKVSESKLSATIAAIKKFQKDVLGWRNCDGKVDAKGTTFKTIAASLENLFITIESVGKKGNNKTFDVAKIQLALYSLKLLDKQNFLKELPEVKKEAKNKLTSSSISFDNKLKVLPNGKMRIAVSDLSATIKAIIKFQVDVVKLRSGDGRVDANGKSFRTIFKAIVESNPSDNVENETPVIVNIPDSLDSGSTGGRINNDDNVSDNEVQLVGKNIVVKISKGEKTATRRIAITKIRDYIFNNYNWNGIVKLMDFVYKENGDQYVRSTDLAGKTKEDNLKIITDTGIKYLIKEQLKYRKKITPNDLKDIVKKLDGEEHHIGWRFINEVIKKKRTYFFDEIHTDNLKDSEGKRISVPSLKDDESTLYNFFRKLVIASNGLWSDRNWVVNMVGLRRRIDKNMGASTRYNDSLVVCWKDDSGNPHVEINIATTEPGYRELYRQLVPQTATAVYGFHHGRQPSGRTRKIMVQGANNGKNVWVQNDKGFNFHQGGNTFSYNKGWLSDYGITFRMMQGFADEGFTLEKLFELNLTLTEIYYLLSQYGVNKVRGIKWVKDKRTGVRKKTKIWIPIAPYVTLEAMAKSEPMKIDKVENGEITISQVGESPRKINIQAAKEWVVNRWYDQRFKESEKEKIGVILSTASGMNSSQMKKLGELKNKKKVVAKIKDEWIVKVIETQFLYYADIKDIDAKAGPDFFRAMVGIRPSKEQAKKDFARIEKLLKKLVTLPLTKKESLVKKLKTGLFIDTNTNRENVRNNTRYDELKKVDIIANATVKKSSAGCQVIYDTEVFYDFWLKLLQRAKKSGQRKWYYTLVDATGWKKTDVV